MMLLLYHARHGRDVVLAASTTPVLLHAKLLAIGALHHITTNVRSLARTASRCHTHIVTQLNPEVKWLSQPYWRATGAKAVSMPPKQPELYQLAS